MLEYSVKLDAFNGPLDLLLHLIKQYEIDIYDIPVAQITEQYLEYVHSMRILQLDIASEYLVMAATLLALKSKMLLPKPEEELLADEFGEEPESDPRDELVQRLIEYKKFKEAATVLKEKEQERSQVFSKSPTKPIEAVDTAQEIQLDVNLYDMLRAFQKLMERKKWETPLETKITRQVFSVEEKMTEIIHRLTKMGGRQSFFDFFTDEKDRSSVVTTFLALLELIKMKQIIATQENHFQDIWLEQTKGGV